MVVASCTELTHMENYNYLGEKLLWRKKEANAEEQKKQDVINLGLVNFAEDLEKLRIKSQNLKKYADDLSETGGNLDVQKSVKQLAELLENQIHLCERATPFIKVTTQEVAGPEGDDEEDEDEGEAWKKTSEYKSPYTDKEEVEMFTVPKKEIQFKNDQKEFDGIVKQWEEVDTKIQEIKDHLESTHPVEFLKISSFIPTENRTN